MVAPDRSQFVIFYRPDGEGYVEQCPWSLMGVTPPPISEPASDQMRYFTSPEYSEGGALAEVKFITTLTHLNSDGQAEPPYINQQDLTLRKVDGNWRILSHRRGPMT